jgi:outer membrane biogenesis lipoprotein LolB
MRKLGAFMENPPCTPLLKRGGHSDGFYQDTNSKHSIALLKMGAWVFFLCLSLSACTPTISPSLSTPTPAVFSNPQQRNTWLASLNSWQAEGSFAARKEGEAWSGSFEWKQLSKEQYNIHFYGPFGVGNTYVLGNSLR